MDSMRSLNTSLPSTRPPPPEQLLQAFKNAALSVTNLYKSAVTDQNASRQAGYQEALEDLLSFLDRENLGLQDGEGWRVRQWATERYDGSAHPQGNDSDDERSEICTRPRSLTPAKEEPPAPSITESEPARAESATQTDEPDASTDHEPAPATEVFRFTGHSSTNHSDHMQTDDDSHIVNAAEASSSVSASSSAPVRLEIVNNKGSRTPHRHGGNQRNVNNRSSTREFTFTAGTKRKLQFPDFFDISNIGSREGSGGNKRGRSS
ncbi:hypothetical protein EDD37DRAFT_389168 [Exophiala viscosa]|uniref:Uncharacterized protein n=1 Tax=Exophiala viscosa TaxID=2486360 RepID=A0AAN6I924_9EURO|nr:hypothetical protein EDD36DRAFT_423070 [Exophiala viscosa]KAI1625465.1 hypothetical protein EDD37DRAFT_389168 [Exophiala viscosa]